MSDKPPAWGGARLTAIVVLVAAPFVGTLWVGSYTRTEPQFIGLPFFYWYLMAWVIISAACTSTAYVLMRPVELARREWRRKHAAGAGREEGGAK